MEAVPQDDAFALHFMATAMVGAYLKPLVSVNVAPRCTVRQVQRALWQKQGAKEGLVPCLMFRKRVLRPSEVLEEAGIEPHDILVYFLESGVVEEDPPEAPAEPPVEDVQQPADVQMQVPPPVEDDHSSLLEGLLRDLKMRWVWGIPEPEIEGLKRLTMRQLKALTYSRKVSRESHEAALVEVSDQRLPGLGFSDFQFTRLLEWVQEEANLVIHVDLPRIGRSLLQDGLYKNIFEVTGEGAKAGYSLSYRSQVESKLFGKAYDDGPAVEKVKYGAININNNSSGITAAHGYGGDAFVLQHLRLRTTITRGDSFQHNNLGTLDMAAHILKDFTDEELKHAIQRQESKPTDHDVQDHSTYKEVQLHGAVDLRLNVAMILVNPSRRSQGRDFQKTLDELKSLCGCPVYWMDTDADKVRAVNPSQRRRREQGG